MVQRIVAQLSWGHNVILIQKLKHLPTRLWYARQTIEAEGLTGTAAMVLTMRG
jgi:predicted nuclease of restriction endonuclease-like (RecB) superfamily